MLESSVIVSLYNGHEYIIKQLESIRFQSKEPDEVLIFDDLSTDNSVEIVKKYISENSLNTWHLYVNKENKGWRKNFIYGITKAKGKFIFTCDQDDIWDKNKIKIQLDILQRSDSVKVLASNYFTFSKNFSFPNSIDYSYNFKKKIFSKKFMNVERPGCTYCFTKEFFDSIFPYWKPIYEHDAFIWRMAIVSHSLAICNDKLIAWRIHSDSTLSMEHKKKSLRKRKEEINVEKSMLSGIEKYLAENNLSITEKEKKFISKYRKLLCDRSEYIDKSSLTSFVHILFDLNLYGYKKQFFRDVITVIRK